jgi:hypothetical protein
MLWGLWVLLALPALWLGILLCFAGPARAAWREPVLRHPVLIIESDDWGPGPASQAQSLQRLAACLAARRDVTGRPAVMTLALTLSLPDGAAMAASGFTAYHGRSLTHAAYADLLAALEAGRQAGVFALQLHGLAHYWPAALLAAARRDEAVRAWLVADAEQETERLPSPLQSRWVDASVLPSRPLAATAIRGAVAEEVACFRRVFGATPAVVVPPTFVWTQEVEAAWAAQGVKVVVTPGRRCTGRDATGGLQCEARPLHNGQRGAGEVLYLVRDRYFEPQRGHRAEQALAALAEKTAQGRPCLLETHRCNFIGNGLEPSLTELERLLAQALARFPDLRFLSSAELAEHYRQGSAAWMVRDLGRRLGAWRQRMGEVPRFARLARWSGLDGLLALFTTGRAA